MARFMLRKAPVGVELARDDVGPATDNPDGVPYRITARNATPAVTVVGSPAELTLWHHRATPSRPMTLAETLIELRKVTVGAHQAKGRPPCRPPQLSPSSMGTG